LNIQNEQAVVGLCVVSVRFDATDDSVLVDWFQSARSPGGHPQSSAPRLQLGGFRDGRPSLALFEVAQFLNREAMVGTSPGRQSGVSGKTGRHRVPEGRQADPDKIPVVPSGLWSIRCSLTMDLRPWLLHGMPSAFKSAASKLALGSGWSGHMVSCALAA